MADFTADLTDGLRIEITEHEEGGQPVFILLVGQYDFHLLPEWDAGLAKWCVEVNLADESHDWIIYQDGIKAGVA